MLTTKVLLGVTTALLLAQPACIVGGYRSGTGGFLWPGGLLGVLVIIAVVFLLMRRRG